MAGRAVPRRPRSPRRRVGSASVATFRWGDDLFVSEYLQFEVLSSLPGQAAPVPQAFGRAGQVSGPLCDACASGGPTPPRRSCGCSDRNELLVPLDRRGEWYRYHHLFPRDAPDGARTGASRSRRPTAPPPEAGAIGVSGMEILEEAVRVNDLGWRRGYGRPTPRHDRTTHVSGGSRLDDRAVVSMAAGSWTYRPVPARRGADIVALRADRACRGSPAVGGRGRIGPARRRLFPKRLQSPKPWASSCVPRCAGTGSK